MSLLKSRFIEMFGQCNKEELIGNVVSICRGASPRPISEYITKDSEGINWIKIGDVSDDSLYITSAEEKITKEGASKSRLVHKGDFILSNSMSFGRPYILGIDGCVHDGWLILSKFSETFNEIFLYYALKSDYVQNQFRMKVNGATVKNLNSDLVKNTKIKVPPIEKQMEFSNFIEQIDKSKFLLQQILEKFELLKKSRFIEMFGNVATNNKRWEKTKLGNKSVIGSSKRIFANEYTTEGIPFYRSKEIIELGMGEKPSVELYISKKRYQEIKEKFGIPIPGDILMTAVGTIGKFWIVPNSKPFYYKDGNLVYIRTKEFNPLFLKKLLEMLIEKYKVENANGSAYTALTIEKLKDLQIVLPPMTLQKQYEEFHIQIDKSKLIIQKALEDLVGKV